MINTDGIGIVEMIDGIAAMTGMTVITGMGTDTTVIRSPASKATVTV
jgi:hypothetical protein